MFKKHWFWILLFMTLSGCNRLMKETFVEVDGTWYSVRTVPDRYVVMARVPYNLIDTKVLGYIFKDKPIGKFLIEGNEKALEAFVSNKGLLLLQSFDYRTNWNGTLTIYEYIQ